ncbi:hypothetical protein JQK88_20215 [Mesorhizobium caraganae]|uniref:hypothetical protein n=1 Tax=Mesorhizobium caraganae TaxID=483206 RepID=UPI0019394266|nr:hypothetical protein [Mesorhizobium caraganae]MBM2713501.1 hypothetical protein [Mesorhizobium caraganae]
MFIRDYPGINTVKVGRLFLKPGDVYETITQSCRMVFHEASDRSLPLGRAGSATLVRYAGVNYVVATRHQLGIARGASVPTNILDTIRIGSGKGLLSNIPLKACIFELSNVDEEYHDVLLFKAADTWKTQHSDQPFFYPLAPFSKANRVKSFLVGYPTIEGVMDEYLEGFVPEQPGSIHIKRAISDCDLDKSYLTNVEFYRRYLNVRERPVVDGYSGGAVFSLTGELENLEIVLDGIVVRAGAQHIHVVDADYLLKIITDQSKRG